MSLVLPSLVLVLLFFSFHGCRARGFGMLDKEPVDGLPSSSKNNEKRSLVRVSRQGWEYSNRPEAIKTESKNPVTPTADVSRKNNLPGVPQKIKVPAASPPIQTDEEPKISVSWKVPHKKRGEEEPGLNLDYLPPKTHPPIHN